MIDFATLQDLEIQEGNVTELLVDGQVAWKKKVADKYTWEAVFESIDAGTYATDYAVGDLVPLDLGSEGVVNMQIAGFNADTLADGSGTAPISWISKELLATLHRMNPELAKNEDGTQREGTGTVGGWEKCEMRAYLENTIKPLIPENVRSRICSVSKKQYAYDTNNKFHAQTTSDDLWIPDLFELASQPTSIYAGFMPDEESKIKNVVGANQSSYWWCRRAATNANFESVYYSGGSGQGKASYVRGIALGFCT